MNTPAIGFGNVYMPHVERDTSSKTVRLNYDKWQRISRNPNSWGDYSLDAFIKHVRPLNASGNAASIVVENCLRIEQPWLHFRKQNDPFLQDTFIPLVLTNEKDSGEQSAFDDLSKFNALSPKDQPDAIYKKLKIPFYVDKKTGIIFERQPLVDIFKRYEESKKSL